MAIEPADLLVLKRMRAENSSGDSCAILGDCHIQNHSIRDFKRIMGFNNVHTFDINGNPTYKKDLNYLLSEDLQDSYDWVIDSGTLYCCFDPCTVLQNILLLLKNKGCVFHTGNLAGFFGRGFYSLSPALFRDFYYANNFDIKCMGTKTRSCSSWKFFDPNHTYLNEHGDFADYDKYIPTIPNDWLINCFAVRENRVEFKKPVPQHFIETKGK